MRILIDGDSKGIPLQWLQAMDVMSRLSDIRFHTIAVARNKPRVSPHRADGPSVLISYRDDNGQRVPLVPVLEEEAEVVDILTKSFAMEFMTLDYVEFLLQPKDDDARIERAVSAAS
jgi:hypothetical protein